MKPFFIKLTATTLSLALIGWLVFSLFIPEYYLFIHPFLLLFFYLSTLSIYAYQLKLKKKDIGKFTRSTMLVTFFKLVAYSALAIVYLVIDKENAIPFVVSLMLLYLIYTFIEVSASSKLSQSENE